MDIVGPRRVIVLHPPPLPLHNQMVYHLHRRGVLVAEEWWGMEYASILMNAVPSMDFVVPVVNIARIRILPRGRGRTP
jgi:hypothetical protein